MTDQAHPGGTVDLGIDGIQDAHEVGRGGFAVVYRAHQPAFDRVVAAKILNSHPDPTSLARFEREVRAMGKLSEHPNIATVLDAGTTPDGRPYLLMPFLSGGSLQDRLEQGETMPPREVAELGVKLAGALEAAHAEQILHRDVKPANVMVGRYGDPLLVDFGIARIAGGHQTTTGVVTATLNHAAPELLDGKPPTVASDVYALGSTLFTLITGRPAFAEPTDETVVPLIRRILTDPVPNLRAHGVDEELASVLETAMAKDPGDRFPSAAAMGIALREALQGTWTPTPPVQPSDSEPPTDRVATPPPAPRVDPVTPPAVATGPDRRPLLIGGGILLLVLVVGGLVLFLGGGEDPVEEEPAEAATDAGVAVPDGSVPLGGVDETELALLEAPSSMMEASAPDVFTVELVDGEATGLVFDAPGGTGLRLSSAQVDLVDPIVGLFRDGGLLAADDDGSGELDVLLDYPTLDEGTYELRMAGLSGGGAVSVSLQLPDIRPLDSPSEGEFADIHDVHAYQVEVAPGQERGLVTESPDGVTLRAVNASGFFVDANSGSGILQMDLSGLGADSYVVFVGPLGETAEYVARPLRGASPAAPEGPLSSSLEDDEIPAPDPSARTVDPFESGTLELGAGEVVVLPFEVVGEGMLMRVVARSPDGAIDPVAALYDEAGTLLASSDDEGFGVNGQDSLIDLPLPTGNFQIAIADHGFEGTGPVDIRFFLQDPLPLGEAPSGSFDGADGPVVRTLEVTPGNPAPASVRVDAPVDTRLRLLAPDGVVLDETEEGGNPPLPTLTLGEGTFYLVASADEPVDFTFEVGS